MKKKITQKDLTKIFNKIQQEYDYESLMLLASTGKFEGFGMTSGNKERTFYRMIKFLQRFYHEVSLEKLTAEEMNVEQEMWDGVQDFIKFLDEFTVSKSKDQFMDKLTEGGKA